MNESIRIKYQDIDVGAIAFDTEKGIGSFEYERTFINRGLDLAPLKMPIKQAKPGKVFTFSIESHPVTVNPIASWLVTVSKVICG